MSAVCSGGTTASCISAVGANSTFSVISYTLEGLMWAAGFIFIIFVIHACYNGLGADKVSFYSLFKNTIYAIAMVVAVLGVVKAIVH
jgi:hypothetical protein